jgi:hypothetical protein
LYAVTHWAPLVLQVHYGMTIGTRPFAFTVTTSIGFSKSGKVCLWFHRYYFRRACYSRLRRHVSHHSLRTSNEGLGAHAEQEQQARSSCQFSECRGLFYTALLRFPCLLYIVCDKQRPNAGGRKPSTLRKRWTEKKVRSGSQELQNCREYSRRRNANHC